MARIIITVPDKEVWKVLQALHSAFPTAKPIHIETNKEEEKRVHHLHYPTEVIPRVIRFLKTAFYHGAEKARSSLDDLHQECKQASHAT